MSCDVIGATYDIVGQHTILVTPTMCDLRCRRSHVRYRMPHRTYDIKQYRRYGVANDVIGHTNDIVVTDL